MKTDWKNYRELQKGETVRHGDHQLSPEDGSDGWVFVCRSKIGTEVSDPLAYGHMRYRRSIRFDMESPIEKNGWGTRALYDAIAKYDEWTGYDTTIEQAIESMSGNCIDNHRELLNAYLKGYGDGAVESLSIKVSDAMDILDDLERAKVIYGGFAKEQLRRLRATLKPEGSASA